MVLPADSYIVINKSIITEIDKRILIDLYQPIIGNKAISLYFTLLNDLEKSFMSDTFTHHHLITVMQVSLEDIQSSKEKLEAVGLLKSYLKKDHINNYLYILYSPISADEFLNHPILNIVLYNNIGKKEYTKIVDSYKVPRLNLREYEDVSHSFDEVFMSTSSNSFITNEDLIKKNNGTILFKKDFDFELLLAGINSNIINEKSLTNEIKNLIINLSYIYNLDVLTMQNLVKSSINEKGTINKENLRVSARNFYQFEHSGNLPTLVYSKQPEYLKSPLGDSSKKAMMIYTFENTHPYQFLKSKYKDGKVVDRDLKVIESLLLDLKLTPGVVNVLLDYVLKINNQKLNKNYIETIGAQWKRLGIETVDEAMNQCIKEHKKNTKVIKTTSKSYNNTKKQESIIPEWFDQNISKEEVSEEEKKELEELMKNYN